jgi:hypothetical protein
VALLSRHAERVSARRFWKHAIAAGLGPPLRDRLVEIRKIVQSGEVNAIWWDRLGLALDDVERRATLKVIRRLQRRAREGGDASSTSNFDVPQTNLPTYQSTVSHSKEEQTHV